MKRVNKKCISNFIASFLLLIGVTVANAGGTFFYYNPEEPKELQKFTKK